MSASKHQDFILNRLKKRIVLLQRQEEHSKKTLQRVLKKMRKLNRTEDDKIAVQVRSLKLKCRREKS